MKQTKLQSFIEAITNTFVGFMVTMMVYPIINWICGIEMTIGQAGLSTILFTLVSVARGYVIRRFFNNLKGVKNWIRNIVRRNYCSGQHKYMEVKSRIPFRKPVWKCQCGRILN
jgi:hypothetical protein